jgi:hypothetical protein
MRGAIADRSGIEWSTMSTLLDQLRSQLQERRGVLVAELDEIDDALARLGAPSSGLRSANGAANRTGRKPSADAIETEKWLVLHHANKDAVLAVDSLFREAASIGVVPNGRRGRERIRAILDRWVRSEEEMAENLGGGRYRILTTLYWNDDDDDDED